MHRLWFQQVGMNSEANAFHPLPTTFQSQVSSLNSRVIVVVFPIPLSQKELIIDVAEKQGVKA